MTTESLERLGRIARAAGAAILAHYRRLNTIQVARRIQVGSSLKFCWVAEGKADIYPRFGTTMEMEWDTAAGDRVYRHSGRDGERCSTLRYNTPSLRNDHFVVGLQG